MPSHLSPDSTPSGSEWRAALALFEGRFDEAEKLIAEARSLGERAQSWSAAVTYGLLLFSAQALRSELGRVRTRDNDCSPSTN